MHWPNIYVARTTDRDYPICGSPIGGWGRGGGAKITEFLMRLEFCLLYNDIQYLQALQSHRYIDKHFLVYSTGSKTRVSYEKGLAKSGTMS